MEGVDGIEFGDVDQVKTLKLIVPDLDRFVHIGKGDAVNGVDFVVAIEVGVEAIHHHDHFVDLFVLRIHVITTLGHLSLMPGVFLWIGIDDEGAI